MKALGWKIELLLNGYWSLQRPDGSRPDSWNYFHDNSIDAWQNAPSIERSPDISERELEKVCAEKDYDFVLRSASGEYFIKFYPSTGDDLTVEVLEHEVGGSTPSEARARAILAALTKEG